MKTSVKKTAIAAAALLAAFTFTTVGTIASAGEQQGKAGYERHDKDAAGHWYGSSSNEWKKTLTEEQKAEMSKLHLALKKELAPLKARINSKRADVKAILAGDDPDKAALAKAIDEISALEKQAMHMRNEHMIKVRGILTPEQKAAFDAGIMNHKERKDGHRHGK